MVISCNVLSIIALIVRRRFNVGMIQISYPEFYSNIVT